MSGNIGMPVSDGGTLQLSLTYDLNNLQTLKAEDEIVEDRTRERQTHSILFEFGYSITNKWSVDGFFSFVRQERAIETRPEERDFTNTQGLGDAVLLLKYNPLSPVSVGYGIKVPVGDSDRRDNGQPLNADLQPGSGAWDQILYGNLSHQFNFRPSLSYFGTVIYRLTGINDDYLGNSSYEFGNELQILAGVGDRVVVGRALLDPSLKFRYRHAQRDKFNEFGFPSSGGKFLFINPGISWSITDHLSYQVNAEFPLYAQVNEVQLSPTFRINTGIYYSFASFKKSEFEIPL